MAVTTVPSLLGAFRVPQPQGRRFAPLLLLLALLCCPIALAQPVRAQVVITTDTIIDDIIDDSVFVTGSPSAPPPTVALVSDGYIAGNLAAYQASTVNVSSGDIVGNLDAYNSSTVNLSGGSVGSFLAAYDTSTVNITGGYINSTLYAYDSSTLNLSGGSVAGGLAPYGTSTVNVSGGSIASNLYAYQASTVNLSGGSIAGDLLVTGTDATLNVYGTGLNLAGPFTDVNTYYVLTGTLADGTPINKGVYLVNGAQISQVHLHDTNPLVALRAQVQALADAGTLSAGNANALLVKLTAAQTALASGDTAGAQDALTAFVNQVNAFVRTGKLTAAQGAPLIAGAQAILDSLG